MHFYIILYHLVLNPQLCSSCQASLLLTLYKASASHLDDVHQALSAKVPPVLGRHHRCPSLLSHPRRKHAPRLLLLLAPLPGNNYPHSECALPNLPKGHTFPERALFQACL